MRFKDSMYYQYFSFIYGEMVLYYLGFCIGGFGLGESIDERPALLSATIVRIMPFQ